jgi:hypothetical protein
MRVSHNSGGLEGHGSSAEKNFDQAGEILSPFSKRSGTKSDIEAA